MSLNAGSRVASYEIVALLGAGGMGDPPPPNVPNDPNDPNDLIYLSA